MSRFTLNFGTVGPDGSLDINQNVGTVVSQWATGLDGMKSLSSEMDFELTGTHGTSVTAYLQTSLDAGVSAIDVACVQFTTASAKSAFNMNCELSVAPFVPTDGSLTNNTVKDGVLGDRLRAKVITVGTYDAGTSLTVKGVTR